jgi:KDO2-lipid IV(A) lauroyltransferase
MRHKKRYDLLKLLEIEGIDEITKALEKNKGVIIAGGHLSAFPLGMLALASLGLPIAALVRQADNARVEEMTQSIRKHFNLTAIYVKPRHEATRRCLTWLKGNRILWIQVDQRNRKGIIVNFMGRLSQVAPGAALLSKRLGSPVLPVVMIKMPDSRYRLIIGKKLGLPINGTDVKSDMEKILEPIGRYIRSYPEQWTWFHKMWKVRKEALA